MTEDSNGKDPIVDYLQSIQGEDDDRKPVDIKSLLKQVNSSTRKNEEPSKGRVIGHTDTGLDIYESEDPWKDIGGK